MMASTSCKLNVKCKQIIYSVSEYMYMYLRQDQETERLPYLERTAKATGVSRSTVAKIRKEKGETGTLLSPRRQTRVVYKPVDSFDQAAIRHKVTEFYTVQKKLPTLRMLHAALVEDLDFPGSIGSLRKLLHHLGYSWRKTRDFRPFLIEKPNVVTQRLAYYANKKDLEQRGIDFVFIDETWIDTSYTSKKCWQGEGTPGVIPTCNRGQRIIVVHAGNRRGFIPGAQLTYKAKSTTGDYHSEMDGRNFTRWLEKLLPNLEEPSVIVMDNASYHSMQVDKFPTSNTKEADIQEWLTRHNIDFEPGMLRPQLLQLARMNRPPTEYSVDRTIRLHGHEVLRLPPYHPDFNPIELIWSQLKDYVRRMNMTFR